MSCQDLLYDTQLFNIHLYGINLSIHLLIFFLFCYARIIYLASNFTFWIKFIWLFIQFILMKICTCLLAWSVRSTSGVTLVIAKGSAERGGKKSAFCCCGNTSSGGSTRLLLFSSSSSFIFFNLADPDLHRPLTVIFLLSSDVKRGRLLFLFNR